MARKKSGGFFGKALEFIGLVDEEDPQDYTNEYQRGYDANPYDAYEGSRQPAQMRPDASRRKPAAPARETPRRAPARANAPRAASAAPRQSAYRGRTEYSSGYEDRSRRTYDDGYEPRAASPAARPAYSSGSRATGSRYSYENVRRVSPEPTVPEVRETPRPVARRPRTVMYSMRGFEDCREVIEHLIAGNTVVLTLEEMDASVVQRALDTLSGAVFALNASIRRASDNTYLLAPGNVDVNDSYEVDRSF